MAKQMLLAFLVVSLAALGLVSRLSADEPAPKNAPSTTTLPNGARIILKEDHLLPLVAVEAWVSCGSADELPGEHGAAHLLEHALFRGTDGQSAGQVDIQIENLGATLSATTSRDWIRISTVVASRFLADAVPVIGDVLARPALRPADIDLEKRVVLDEITTVGADPVRALTDRLAALAFGESPYGRPISGTPAEVQKLTAQTLRAYLRRCFVGRNVTMVLVGDFDSRKAKELAAAALSALPRGEGSSPAPQQSHWLGAGQPPERVPIGGDLAYWAVGLPAPGADTPRDVCAMDVLYALLDGGPGGMLPRELVGRGTARSVDLGYLTQKRPGMLTAVIAAEPHRIADAASMFWEVAEKLRRFPVSAEELAAAKQRLLYELAFDTETFAGQAYSIGFYEAIGARELGAAYEQEVSKVTAVDVQRAAARYLLPDKAVAVVAGAEAANNGP